MKMLMFSTKNIFLLLIKKEKKCVCMNIHFYPNHCETQGIFGNWLKLVKVLMMHIFRIPHKTGKGFKMLTCMEDEDHIPSDA